MYTTHWTLNLRNVNSMFISSGWGPVSYMHSNVKHVAAWILTLPNLDMCLSRWGSPMLGLIPSTHSVLLGVPLPKPTWEERGRREGKEKEGRRERERKRKEYWISPLEGLFMLDSENARLITTGQTSTSTSTDTDHQQCPLNEMYMGHSIGYDSCTWIKSLNIFTSLDLQPIISWCSKYTPLARYTPSPPHPLTCLPHLPWCYFREHSLRPCTV